MESMDNDVTYIGETNYRAQRKRFGIRTRDRFFHMHLIGRTGTGKSTLIKNMLLQDIRAGRGCALFDPHGDLVEELLPAAQAERPGELIYLDATEARPSWHFNPLGGVHRQHHALAAAGLVDVFKNIWGDQSLGARSQHLLRNVAFTLLEAPGASLALIPQLLTDGSYRRSLLQGVRNERVRQFWTAEYDRYSPGMRSVVIAPLLNKAGALLTDPRLNRILGAPKSSFQLSRIMDTGGLLLVNLAKGRIGEGPSALLGSLLVSYLSLAALGRVRQPEHERRNFFVYLDEFHTYSTLSLATMLPELRKFKTALVLANQHLAQVDRDVRDAVLGNAGTLVSFRVGAQDADLLAREFEPTFGRTDLLALPNYHVYLKLMINGQPSGSFSAQTLASFG